MYTTTYNSHKYILHDDINDWLDKLMDISSTDLWKRIYN